MFTGIITDIGTIISKDNEGDICFGIKTNYNLSKLNIGSSIACSGVCLSVKKIYKNTFYANVSRETLSCTTLNSWEKGTKINLERSLKINDEIGGHIVTGHIDFTAKVSSIDICGSSHIVNIEYPEIFEKYIAKKGSITVDGVSLTVNNIQNNIFSVNIIPITWEKTIFQYIKVDNKVNLEVDILARYIEKIYLHSKDN